MKARDLQAKIDELAGRAAVYEEILTFLERAQVISPVRGGTFVPPAVVSSVREEIAARLEAVAQDIFALEESDVRVEAHANVVRLGPGRS